MRAKASVYGCREAEMPITHCAARAKLKGCKEDKWQKGPPFVELTVRRMIRETIRVKGVSSGLRRP